MHLIVEQRGCFVSKHQGRLRVEKDKQRLAEAPIMHLEQLLIVSNGVGLSSDVVRVCCEEGIPIHFLNGHDGDDYGTLFASGLTGMAILRAIVRGERNPNKLAWMEVYRWVVVLAYLRHRFFETSFARSLGGVTLGGVIIVVVSALLGSAA